MSSRERPCHGPDSSLGSPLTNREIPSKGGISASRTRPSQPGLEPPEASSSARQPSTTSATRPSARRSPAHTGGRLHGRPIVGRRDRRRPRRPRAQRSPTGPEDRESRRSQAPRSLKHRRAAPARGRSRKRRAGGHGCCARARRSARLAADHRRRPQHGETTAHPLESRLGSDGIAGKVGRGIGESTQLHQGLGLKQLGLRPQRVAARKNLARAGGCPQHLRERPSTIPGSRTPGKLALGLRAFHPALAATFAAAGRQGQRGRWPMQP